MLANYQRASPSCFIERIYLTCPPARHPEVPSRRTKIHLRKREGIGQPQPLRLRRSLRRMPRRPEASRKPARRAVIAAWQGTPLASASPASPPLPTRPPLVPRGLGRLHRWARGLLALPRFFPLRSLWLGGAFSFRPRVACRTPPPTWFTRGAGHFHRPTGTVSPLDRQASRRRSCLRQE